MSLTLCLQSMEPGNKSHVFKVFCPSVPCIFITTIATWPLETLPNNDGLRVDLGQEMLHQFKI